jgi:hypothetical protein
MTNAVYPQMTLKTVFVTVVDKYSTGLDKAVASPSVKVGPSPAHDVLNIVGAQAVANIKVYSLTGACVISVDRPADFIDISALAPGLYTAKLTGEGLDANVKFIKK